MTTTSLLVQVTTTSALVQVTTKSALVQETLTSFLVQVTTMSALVQMTSMSALVQVTTTSALVKVTAQPFRSYGTKQGMGSQDMQNVGEHWRTLAVTTARFGLVQSKTTVLADQPRCAEHVHLVS